MNHPRKPSRTLINFALVVERLEHEQDAVARLYEVHKRRAKGPVDEREVYMAIRSRGEDGLSSRERAQRACLYGFCGEHCFLLKDVDSIFGKAQIVAYGRNYDVIVRYV